MLYHNQWATCGIANLSELIYGEVIPVIEYHVENTNGYPITKERLKTLGADDWQLIQAIQDVAYFSRIKAEQPKPAARKRTVKK